MPRRRVTIARRGFISHLRKDKNWWLAEAIALALVAIALVAASLFVSPRALFRIEATTASMTLVVTDEGPSPCWPAGAFDAYNMDLVPATDASGLRLAAGTTVTFTSDPDLPDRVAIAVYGPEASDGHLRSAGQWDGCNSAAAGTPAASHLAFSVPLKQGTRMLQLRGAVTVGQLPDEQAADPQVLSQGKIVVTTEAWPLHDNSVSTVVDLSAGDVVRLCNGGDKQLTDDVVRRCKRDGKEPTAAGFVRFSSDGPMRVVVTGIAESARVERIGQGEPQPVAIAPSLLDRIRANAAWFILVPLGWLLVRIVKAVRGWLIGTTPE